MRAWLETALFSCPLTLGAEEYAMGRGLSQVALQDFGVGVWAKDSLEEDAPDLLFRKRFGQKGSRVDGSLCIPLRCPRGNLIGAEFRSWNGPKVIRQFLLPEAEWNPVFIGLTPQVMEKVWAGGSVWVAEGLFDVGPLGFVIPSQDVVVGTLRARLSDRHILFLRRFCRGYTNMVYDNDETGRKMTHGYLDETGTHRWGALELLNRVGMRCRDVPYFGGKDPGEIWERSGTEGLSRAFGWAA
jgi:hypothetical protein